MPRVKKLILVLSILCSIALGALICFFILSALNRINTNIELDISIHDKLQVYNGSPVYADEYEITNGKLSKGDVIDIEYIGYQTNVGVSTSTANVKIYNENGHDVSSNYKVNVKTGKIEVVKCDLVLKCKSSVLYSPNFIDEAEFEIVSGHIGFKEKIIPSLDENYVRGSEDVRLSASVYDYFGNDVTSNYNIEIKDKLVINKIPLLVMSQSASKVYDGTALFNKGYYSNGLLSGDYIDYNAITNYTSITDVKDSGKENRIDIEQIVIKDVDGKVVTNSYTILKQDLGRLYITPKDITVTTTSYSTIFAGSGTNFDTETKKWDCDSDIFKSSFESASSMNSFEDAGTYLNIISFDSTTEGIDNYNIHYNYGVVTISKAIVNVYLPTIYGSTTSTRDDLLNQISYDSIKISAPEAQEIPSLLSIEIPNYDFQIMGQGTYTYGAQLMEDSGNYEVIIHPGNIIIN